MLRFFLLLSFWMGLQLWGADTPKRPVDHAVAHASEASSAAQAISASQQAAMMFRLLMAKGVMDYFQRKEMEKANEVLAKKMEKLQQELRSGKLSPEQYGAIKAAVEETYAKYSKMDLPKDKQAQSETEASEKGLTFPAMASPSNTSALTAQGSEKPEPRLSSQDLANMNPESSEKSLQGKETNAQSPTQSNSGGGVVGAQLPGLAVMVGSTLPSHQTVSIQNAGPNEALEKSKAAGGAAVQPAPRSNLDLSRSLDLSSDWERERELTAHQWGDSDAYLENQNSDSTGLASSLLKPFSLASLRNFLKPIRFQKNPFSTKLQTEEGFHPALLLIFAGCAFLMGLLTKKERKTERVIPEVILNPEKKPLSQATALTVEPIPMHHRRSRRA